VQLIPAGAYPNGPEALTNSSCSVRFPGQGHTCTTGTSRCGLAWETVHAKKQDRAVLFWGTLPLQQCRLAQSLLSYCNASIAHLEDRRWSLAGFFFWTSTSSTAVTLPVTRYCRVFLWRHVPVSKGRKGMETLKPGLPQAGPPGCYKTQRSQRTHQQICTGFLKNSPEISCGQHSALFLGKTQ